eukprot:51775_1
MNQVARKWPNNCNITVRVRPFARMAKDLYLWLDNTHIGHGPTDGTFTEWNEAEYGGNYLESICDYLQGMVDADPNAEWIICGDRDLEILLNQKIGQVGQQSVLKMLKKLIILADVGGQSESSLITIVGVQSPYYLLFMKKRIRARQRQRELAEYKSD